MVRRKKNIVRITEKLKSKYRDKHICIRCNSPFDTEELLQSHRENQHGEFKVNDSLRDLSNRQTVNTCKTEQRIPKRKDWILQLGNQTFMYDPWFKVYRLYKLGEGLLDDLDRVVADEDSKYFKTLKELIDNPRMKIPPRVTPLPKIRELKSVSDAKQGKPITLIEESLLPPEIYQCVNCGNIHRITTQPQMRCPDCDKFINVDGGSQVIVSDKVTSYDLGSGGKSIIHKCKIVNHDTLNHRKPEIPRLDKETSLILCPACEYNIFVVNPLIAEARQIYNSECVGNVVIVESKGRI